MNEEVMQTNEAFMDIAIKKMEEQDKKIIELAEQIGKTLNNSEDTEHIRRGIDEIKMAIKNIRLPDRELQELSTRLKVAASLLTQPVKSKVLHHHHVPKLTWITAGLFLGFCLLVAGWYMTADKLSIYTANDTKYRYLKLDTTSRGLQKYLDLTDSLYKSNPNLKQTVLETEELNRKHLEMLQKARQMESEATDLKRKVYAK